MKTPLAFDDMKRPTQSQAVVLRWLRLYPAVYICWTGHRADRPMWTHYWRDDQARKQMLAVSAVLGGGKSEDCHVSHPSGGTPPLRKSTFAALCSQGWIQVVAEREPRKGWSDMYYYSITKAGEYALQYLARCKQEGCA